MINSKIGFIGAGQMASAMVHGLLKQGMPKEHCFAYTPHLEHHELLSKHITVTASVEPWFQTVDLLVLAVKPQVLPEALAQLPLQQWAPKQQMVLSVVTGIPFKTLSHYFGTQTRIIRCMPNTPVAIGEGATVMLANTTLSEKQRLLIETLLSSMGTARWINTESQLDQFTAITGSGPAYFFLWMELIQRVSQEWGLEPSLVNELVTQTAVGAALMAHSQPDRISELRAQVTSPNGTTQRALETFQQENLESVVRKSLQAALKRAKELSENTDVYTQ